MFELRAPYTYRCVKNAGGLHYFECFTKGYAKALDLIYTPSSNRIRSLSFASASQKVPLTMPVSYLSKADKNLAVAGLLRDCRPRVSQRVVSGCSGHNRDAILFISSLEKINDGRTV